MILFSLSENERRTVTLTDTISDTTGQTLEVWLTPRFGGDSIQVGSAAGAAASDDVAFTIDVSGVPPGDYYVWVGSGRGSGDEVTLIPSDQTGRRPLVIIYDTPGV